MTSNPPGDALPGVDGRTPGAASPHDPEAPSADRVRRGPVLVMLVDNAVVGDSRVQKQAHSMQQRGWDVTLVGRRARMFHPRHTEFDGVPAVMAYVDRRAGIRDQRPTLLRNPLAYRNRRVESRANALADAALARAANATAELRLRGRDEGARRVGTRLRTGGAVVRRRTVDYRSAVSAEVRSARQSGTGAIERVATRLWTRVLGDRAWERLDPSLWDWELTYGPIVDELAPDIIHANDARMLHVAVRAKLRAAAHGRTVRVVWDAHEYLAGVAPYTADLRWQPAQVALQRQFARYADAVVTVSDTLAGMLMADHDLPTRPTVVLNAPEIDRDRVQLTDIRSECGLGPDQPLLVYSGGAKPARGLELVIEALPLLPDVHAALVVLRTPDTPPSDYVASLQVRAQELGVAERLHVLPYVPVADVVGFLSTADVGVFPGLPYLNHSISLVTKFLEYSQARLPIVVSNLKVMAETVRETGQGEVFEPEDLPGFVQALRSVLQDKQRYQRAYEDPDRMEGWTWARQADLLDELYREVLDRDERILPPGLSSP